MKVLICLLITCTLLLTSCGIKELPSDKQDYVGTWTSENTILTISKSAKVEYKKQLSDVSSKSVNGPIKKFDGNNFIVGALGIETVFVVSETPHMEAGVIKMTVDGEELVKQE